MLENTVLELFKGVFPSLFLFTIIVTSLRVAYLLHNKAEFVLYKELFSLGFILYIMFLFYVVTFQDVDWSTSNFVPFHEIFRYKFGSRLFIKNILGNLILFMPFGFFIGHYIRTMKYSIAFILCLLVSIAIEVTQLMVGRVFDIDDILLNLVGGLIGFTIFVVICKVRDKLPSFFRSDLFYNICVILILVVIIIYLINFVCSGGMC